MLSRKFGVSSSVAFFMRGWNNPKNIVDLSLLKDRNFLAGLLDLDPEGYVLTDAEVGVLGCANTLATRSPYTSTIGDGVNSAQCAVTRVDPTAHGGTCTTNIPYLFRTLPGGMEGCELAKNPGEQMAAVINVVFPPEPRVELNGKALTVIVFPNPAGGAMVPFTMPRCKGTLDPDANDDGVRIDGVSPDPTIAEVLTNPGALVEPPATTIDVIPGGLMEWACIEALRRGEIIVDKLTVPAGSSPVMSGLRVLFTSIASMLLIEIASNSNWRELSPKVPVLVLAIPPPSRVTAP